MKIRPIISFFIVIVGCASPRFSYDFGQPRSMPVGRDVVVPKAVMPAPLQEAPAEVQAESGFSSVPGTRPAKRQGAYQKGQKNAAIVPAVLPGPAVPLKVHSDLTRSAIFLVGGGILLLIGGDILVVIGSLSLLIGLIFGIKWLLRKQ